MIRAGLPLLLALAVLAAAPSPCGKERWAVKVGRDAGAGKIELHAPLETTIAGMRAWSAPSTLGPDRVAPHETSQYSLSATLSGYKLEADRDIHLVLSDSLGATVIAEIPAPACASGSPWQSRIAAARASFLRRFRVSEKYRREKVPVRIEGIGFFDFIHGQTGVAPNGIEIHPVLAVAFPGAR